MVHKPFEKGAAMRTYSLMAQGQLLAPVDAILIKREPNQVLALINNHLIEVAK